MPHVFLEGLPSIWTCEANLNDLSSRSSGQTERRDICSRWKPPGCNNVSGERWMSSVKGCNRLKTYRILDGSAILSKGLREDFWRWRVPWYWIYTGLRREEPLLEQDKWLRNPTDIANCCYKVIGAILFSAGNEYIITSYNPFIYFNKIRFGMGRDPKADLYTSKPGLVVVTCVHLGGDTNVSWQFSIQEGSRSKDSDSEVIIMRANGGNM